MDTVKGEWARMANGIPDDSIQQHRPSAASSRNSLQQGFPSGFEVDKK